MISLYIVGSLVEAELGKLRFGVLYAVSALGGSVASYLMGNPLEFGLGASGAIFGLMGAFFVLARRRGLETGSIVGLIAINLILSFTVANIDWRAHVGGLISGFVVSLGLAQSAGRGFGRSRTSRQATATTSDVVTAVVTTCAVTGVLVALTLLSPGRFSL
jgi:membrane associated rhomboid family serine protease